MASIYLVVSKGTPAWWHNSVISNGNGEQVCFCLALMAISYNVINPKSIISMDTILPRKSSLGRRRMDSFWNGMIALMMKPYQNLAAIFRSHF